MRGIVMLAIGPPDYGRLALNLAVSIRHFSGDIPMQLIYDKQAITGLSGAGNELFDVLTEIDEADSRLNGKLYPGYAKLSLYKYLEFDKSLYIDVDSVCFRDITPLLQKERNGFESEVQGWGDLTTLDYGIQMQWSTGPDIAQHYKLNANTRIPFINSSAQFIDKGDVSRKVFSKALDNINNPIPAKDLHIGWGKKQDHRQPDELYMNIALAQLKHDPTCTDKLVYFHLKNKAGLSEQVINKDYYFLGCYGSIGTNHRRIYDKYNAIMRGAMRNVLGKDHLFKIRNLMTSKFMVYEPMLR